MLKCSTLCRFKHIRTYTATKLHPTLINRKFQTIFALHCLHTVISTLCFSYSNHERYLKIFKTIRFRTFGPLSLGLGVFMQWTRYIWRSYAIIRLFHMCSLSLELVQCIITTLGYLSFSLFQYLISVSFGCTIKSQFISKYNNLFSCLMYNMVKFVVYFDTIDISLYVYFSVHSEEFIENITNR